MNKLKNECFKCKSKRCHERVGTRDLTFDEIACDKHKMDLYKYSDEVLGKDNGVLRSFITSTGYFERGEKPNE